MMHTAKYMHQILDLALPAYDELFEDIDISGLVEWVLLVGGMERGRFLPSISSLVGFRNGEGFEMGAGPSLSAGGIGMVFGLGFTATSGKLNLPINFVFSPKKENSGAAFSILLGFNMSK